MSDSRFFITMKRFLLLSALVFLVSCAAPPPATQPIVLPSTATSTSTIQPTEPPLLATATETPLPPPTVTPVSCNPQVADFCITAGNLVLQRPFRPPYNASVDATYRYATTAQGKREPHHGVEFLNSTGTPVLAAGDGVVYYAGPDTDVRFSPWGDFYGNVVVIQHTDDLFTLYAHLSRIDVQTGQAVVTGEVVGAVGQSGVATGSHLHFEVRQGDATDYFATQNPELWLVPEKDDEQRVGGAIALSIVNAAGDFQSTTLTLQRYAGASLAPEKTFYLETYVPEMTRGPENAALSGLKAGRYRIALKLNGYLYERWVEVQSGKLTQVVIVVQ